MHPRGYLALAISLSRGLGSLEHSAGCWEGLYWSDPLLWESWEITPKAIFELQGAGGGVQAPQWRSGQHNLSSRSISRYLITGETHELSAALCCPGTAVQLLLWLASSWHPLLPLCCIWVSVILPQKVEMEGAAFLIIFFSNHCEEHTVASSTSTSWSSWSDVFTKLYQK